MRLVAAPIEGVFVVEVEAIEDARGVFARTYDADAFAARGLCAEWPQCNVSFNVRRGTLRGMHLQRAPHGEPKLVRCTRGAIFDVALDLRPASPTFGRWYGVDLTADNRRALYLPVGVAHGFQTLEPSSEVFYQMGARYEPSASLGVRWNDPRFSIEWPLDAPFVSERDASFPDYAAVPE